MVAVIPRRSQTAPAGVTPLPPARRRWSYNLLGDALDQGLCSEEDLDTAVRHVLTQKFAAGLFDGRASVSLDRLDILDSAPHRALALEAAEQGIVLLQNKNTTLPMTLSDKNIALFGPLAIGEDCKTALIGSYVLTGAEVPQRK